MWTACRYKCGAQHSSYSPFDHSEDPGEGDAEPDENQDKKDHLAHPAITGGGTTPITGAPQADVCEEARHAPAKGADQESDQRADAGDYGASEHVAEIEAV